MPNKKNYYFLLVSYNDEWLKYLFLYIIFKGKKLMQWLESPLQPKGVGFKLFPEFSFPSTNEMDENKLPLCIFKKLIA